jgi:hypothetical protein
MSSAGRSWGGGVLQAVSSAEIISKNAFQRLLDKRKQLSKIE